MSITASIFTAVAFWLIFLAYATWAAPRQQRLFREEDEARAERDAPMHRHREAMETGIIR